MNMLRSAVLFTAFLGAATGAQSQGFYNQATIQTIEVYMSQPNWDQLLDNAYATTGDYIMADSVAINGTMFDSVGVKYKGNSSYNANQVKNPWHIELDTYKEHDYQGYKDIKLANVYKDPSFLRDVLGYQIARQYMDAPLANYANLYVNGTLIGLYSNTEAISKSFVKDRFGSKSNTFFSCSPPDGANPMSGAYPNLVYLGADSTNYYDAYELKSDYGWNELIALCDTLANHTANIETVLDVDRALWMLAFDNVLVNLDSYIGQFSQNYYLYKDDFGRFLPIVWDLNESFGTFSGTGTGNLTSTTAKQQMSHLLHSSDANFPLISELLAIPTYKKMYLAHYKTMLTENFTSNGSHYTTGQYLQSVIDAAVQADPNKFFTYAQFNQNLTSDVVISGPPPMGGSIPGITNLMNGRYIYLMGLGDFTAVEPNIANINLSNVVPTLGSSVAVTATVTNSQSVFLRYRNQQRAPFLKVEMFDDGNHNDGAANDNVFGADMPITALTTEYYIYAENSDIGKFSPMRAQHEFYTLTITGGIAPGDIVINEFMASNDTTVADQDGEYDDWIELYNNSSTAIDISGYGLSDDIADLGNFTFPAGTVMQPNSYLIVWADGDVNQSGNHADFKISASGESLYLTDAGQTIIDSVAFGAQNTDVSFGRYPNGTGAFITMPATFGAQNTNGQTTDIPEFTQSAKFMLYPNPASDYFKVKTIKNTATKSEVVVYNATGQKIYGADFNTETTVYTTDWPNGMYYIWVDGASQKLMMQK